MITDGYKQQLQQMHSTENWGITGARNGGDVIVSLIKTQFRGARVVEVLDFGCGKGTLGAYLTDNCSGVVVHGYDPGIPSRDKLPDRTFDLIVSTDVLEHIEPDQLDDVLEWIYSHSTKGVFHHIACSLDGHYLPDGRPRHLIVEEPQWWAEKIQPAGWTLMRRADHWRRKKAEFKKAVQLYHERTG